MFANPTLMRGPQSGGGGDYTCTVADLSSSLPGYYGSIGNIVGNITPDGDQWVFAYTPDGSSVEIIYGSSTGTVTWNGQIYALEESEDGAVYSGAGLSGPYLTTGSFNFSFTPS